MARPKNTDQILLALKVRLLEFERVNGLSYSGIPETLTGITVVTLLEDLKAIFFENTKIVAPFYLEAIKELEEQLKFVHPAKFDRLAKDAKTRLGVVEPESVIKAREMAKARVNGQFYCHKCMEVIDNIDVPSVQWNRSASAYEHAFDCTEEKDFDTGRYA